MDGACEVETSPWVWRVRRLQCEAAYPGYLGAEKIKCRFLLWLALCLGFLLKQCPFKKKLEMIRE